MVEKGKRRGKKEKRKRKNSHGSSSVMALVGSTEAVILLLLFCSLESLMSPLEKQFQLEGAILLYTNRLYRGGRRDEIGVFFLYILYFDKRWVTKYGGPGVSSREGPRGETTCVATCFG